MTLPTLLTDPFNDVLRPHQPRRGDTPLWACLPNETASAMESHLGSQGCPWDPEEAP